MRIAVKGATSEPGVAERGGDAQVLAAKKDTFRCGQCGGRSFVEQGS